MHAVRLRIDAEAMANSSSRDAAPEWTHFEHGADIGVRGTGPSLAAAFVAGALAMTAITTEPDRVRPLAPVRVTCEAPSPALLFVDWLNVLIREMATRGMLFGRFDVETDGHRVAATAWGEHVDVARHEPVVEIKGATYTELAVGQDADGLWYAQCVVDV